jgi:uncharacterized membrane protein
LVDEETTQKKESVGAIPRARIQSLSDLIFGLALSIGALTLVGQQPSSTSQLGFAIGLYGLSFLILISVWRLYSSVTSVLPGEQGTLVDLNILLLFFVSVEPYLFNELFVLGSSLYAFVSGMYSIDLAAMFLILGYFMNALLDEERHIIPKELLKKWRYERNITLVVALIFIVSLIPLVGESNLVVTSTPETTYIISVRSLLWILALVVGWTGRALGHGRSPFSVQPK